MKTLGIILARAGSQGLSGKHLLPLCGRPVIDYTFDHAEAAKSLDAVVVSTDCKDVGARAVARGFDWIRRPAELATADASVQDALLHALRCYETKGRQVDAVVLLYGNVPVRGVKVTDRAVDLLQTTRCDSVRSFCPVGKWHPAWMATLDGDRVRANQINSIHRRQDLTPLLLHDGAVVAVSRRAMLQAEATPHDPHAFFGKDRRGITTEIGETIEIDHQRDLFWAEAVLRERDSRLQAPLPERKSA